MVGGGCGDRGRGAGARFLWPPARTERLCEAAAVAVARAARAGSRRRPAPLRSALSTRRFATVVGDSDRDRFFTRSRRSLRSPYPIDRRRLRNPLRHARHVGDRHHAAASVRRSVAWRRAEVLSWSSRWTRRSRTTFITTKRWDGTPTPASAAGRRTSCSRGRTASCGPLTAARSCCLDAGSRCACVALAVCAVGRSTGLSRVDRPRHGLGNRRRGFRRRIHDSCAHRRPSGSTPSLHRPGTFRLTIRFEPGNGPPNNHRIDLSVR